MARFEFTRKQRLFIWSRAGGNCEKCKARLKPGEGEYDHIIAQGYGGENTIDNGQLLCRICHKTKTGRDKGITEKVKRMRDRQTGVMPPSTRPIKSAGFPRTSAPRAPKPKLAPKSIFWAVGKSESD